MSNTTIINRARRALANALIDLGCAIAPRGLVLVRTYSKHLPKGAGARISNAVNLELAAIQREAFIDQALAEHFPQQRTTDNLT
jgi:hypothetical protein